MLNPEKRSQFDQNIALTGELWPRMWFSLFQGCKAQGFSPEQSLDLVKTYILASNSTAVTPTSFYDPPKDREDE